MNKMMLTVGVALTAFAAATAETPKLPTGYGDPADDIQSGSVDGLTWTDAARAYKIKDDIVLVFTNTPGGKCSFTIAPDVRATADYLAVAGGGSGGTGHNQLVGGGGGAGGVVSETNRKLEPGEYVVTVGAGGEPAKVGDPWNSGANGGDSTITWAGQTFLQAYGGGAGSSGSGNQYNASGKDGGSGGGSSSCQQTGVVGTQGKGTAGQGNDGGMSNASQYYAGGGGGAGGAGGNAEAGHGGVGGEGWTSEITGESITYAGGGAGGTVYANTDVTVKGGVGGGSSSVTSAGSVVENGVNQLGGGGAGASVFNGAHTPGSRGGDGVVVIRIAGIGGGEGPLKGVEFTGEARWFNIGTGNTRETVIVYTNVNDVGTLTLSSGATARFLLVGGGGPGGNGGDKYSGAGGGAGGFVETNDLQLTRGTYTIAVGKGGEPVEMNTQSCNNDGMPSSVMKGETEIAKALGGGGGGLVQEGDWRYSCGNPYFVCSSPDGKEYDYSKSTVASGGGGCYLYSTYAKDPQYGGKVQNDQGNNGADFADGRSGGGGGAGEAAMPRQGKEFPSVGGNGKTSDITGEDVWYAGGGSAGSYASYSSESAAGSLGGGGGSSANGWSPPNSALSENGVDGLGGGGAGSSYAVNPNLGDPVLAPAGRGGNGVVIVRIMKVASRGMTLYIR